MFLRLAVNNTVGLHEVDHGTVAVTGSLFRGEHGKIDIHLRVAGQGAGKFHAGLLPLRQIGSADAAGYCNGAGIDHGVEGLVVRQLVQTDHGVEGVAGRLHAHLGKHIFITVLGNGQDQAHDLGNGLHGEIGIYLTGSDHGAVQIAQGYAQAVGIDLGKFGDIAGRLSIADIRLAEIQGLLQHRLLVLDLFHMDVVSFSILIFLYKGRGLTFYSKSRQHQRQESGGHPHSPTPAHPLLQIPSCCGE